jgi:hypothetical protein
MTPKERKAAEVEPTLEELERLIAERYPSMPADGPSDTYPTLHKRAEEYQPRIIRVGTRRRPPRKGG